MFASRSNASTQRSLCRLCQATKPPARRSYGTRLALPRASTGRSLQLAYMIGISIASYQIYTRFMLPELHADAPTELPPPVDMVVEQTRKKGLSKEDNRDMISSQHLQVKQSWENPGVYAWGSNAGKVVAPDSNEACIKTPRRISYFDGRRLRDIKLSQDSGAAITEDGDLLQWGVAYSTERSQPTPTLRGKNLISLAISQDRVLALSSSGQVYSLPVSQADQEAGPKLSESGWIPFFNRTSPISYRLVKVPSSSWSDRVTTISAGQTHVLLLTSSGRLFSAACSSTSFPNKGQLGIPGLTWEHRPPGPYDQAHELTTLRGFNITAIATGDEHSIALDSESRVFAFGDNSSGQLGLDVSSEAPYIDSPALVPLQKLYAGTSLLPRVTSIAAGGANTFFTIDAKRVAAPAEDPSTIRNFGRITADTWACGSGILGSLGTGRWTHMQGSPAKIKALSGLFEWDEQAHTSIPIRLGRISVGTTHASATMANVTYVEAHSGSSENDTNWGADCLWWGGNEHYQLGIGKRNNVNSPMYIRPLEGGDGEHRFHVTPKKDININGRTRSVEQRVECGRFVSAVYSAIC